MGGVGGNFVSDCFSGRRSYVSFGGSFLFIARGCRASYHSLPSPPTVAISRQWVF